MNAGLPLFYMNPKNLAGFMSDSTHVTPANKKTLAFLKTKNLTSHIFLFLALIRIMESWQTLVSLDSIPESARDCGQKIATTPKCSSQQHMEVRSQRAKLNTSFICKRATTARQPETL